MTILESLREALEADHYAAMAEIIRHLDWEMDAEARHALAEWIELGELERNPLMMTHSVRSFPRKRESSDRAVALGPRFRGDEWKRNDSTSAEHALAVACSRCTGRQAGAH